MVAYVQENDRSVELAKSVESAKKSVELVQTLYRLGLTDFENVLVMQRSLFQQEDRLADSYGQVSRNLIRLYKSTGGGWQPDTVEIHAELERDKHGDKG
jgi:outer membrane protein TolC